MRRRQRWAVLIPSCLLAIAATCAAQDGLWLEKRDMPEARFGFAIAVVNGRIYTIGGAADAELNQLLSTVHEYDPIRDRWTRKEDMPTERFGLAASVVAGKIYAIGGWDGNALATVEEYDPATNRWTTKADLPEARYTLSAIAVSGKVYAIAGRVHDDPGAAAGQGPPGAVFEYDPEADTWTEKTAGHSGHWLATSVVDQMVYVFGGTHFFHEQGLAPVSVYDPAADTWTGRKRMAKPMITATSTLDRTIFVVGGWSHWDDQEKGQGFLTQVFKYDPPTETWTEVAELPTPRRPATAVVNGRIYAIGGTKVWPPDPLGTVEEYTPEGWIPRAVSPGGKLTVAWGRIKAER